MVPTQLGWTGSFIRLCVSYYPRQTASTFKEKMHRKLLAKLPLPLSLYGKGEGPITAPGWAVLGRPPLGTAAKASRATVLPETWAATAPGPGPASSHKQGHIQRTPVALEGQAVPRQTHRFPQTHWKGRLQGVLNPPQLIR